MSASKSLRDLREVDTKFDAEFEDCHDSREWERWKRQFP